MSLTDKQREIIIKNIGFLDGLGWVFVIDERMTQIAEALDCVCSDLRQLLEDGGAEE